MKISIEQLQQIFGLLTRLNSVDFKDIEWYYKGKVYKPSERAKYLFENSNKINEDFIKSGLWVVKNDPYIGDDNYMYIENVN